MDRYFQLLPEQAKPEHSRYNYDTSPDIEHHKLNFVMKLSISKHTHTHTFSLSFSLSFPLLVRILKNLNADRYSIVFDTTVLLQCGMRRGRIAGGAGGATGRRHVCDV